MMLLRVLFTFFMPGVLLVSLSIFIDKIGILDPWLPGITRLYPYFVLAIGFLLGWRFNKSRLAYGIIILVLADRAILYFINGGILTQDTAIVVLNAVALLVPLNFTVITLMKERGLFTIRGRYRLSLFLLQPLIIGLSIYFKPGNVDRILQLSFVEFDLLNHNLLPQLTLICYLIAFVVIVFSFRRSLGAIESGFFWALFTTFLAINEGAGERTTIYFAMANLILVIALIETSYGMAYRDTLTGLLGRRAMNEFLLKLGNQYAVTMLDIDHFKKFNDRYGHDVGDQVLKRVAVNLSQVSGGGRVFRYGGEEFTIIFPDKSASDVLPNLEDLRKVIANSGFTLRDPKRPKKKPKNSKSSSKSNKTVKITVSMGVADSPNSKVPAEEIIRKADKALYKAKKAGRNCVKKFGK